MGRQLWTPVQLSTAKPSVLRNTAWTCRLSLLRLHQQRFNALVPRMYIDRSISGMPDPAFGCAKLCANNQCFRVDPCYSVAPNGLCPTGSPGQCSVNGTVSCQTFFNLTSNLYQVIGACNCALSYYGPLCQYTNASAPCTLAESIRFCGVPSNVLSCNRTVSNTVGNAYSCNCTSPKFVPSNTPPVLASGNTIALGIPQLCGAVLSTCSPTDITTYLGPYGSSCQLACDASTGDCRVANYSCLHQGCIPYAPDMVFGIGTYLPNNLEWIQFYTESRALLGLSTVAFGLCGASQCLIQTGNITVAPTLLSTVCGPSVTNVTTIANYNPVTGVTVYSTPPGLDFACACNFSAGYINNASSPVGRCVNVYNMSCPMNSYPLGYDTFCSTECQLQCQVNH